VKSRRAFGRSCRVMRGVRWVVTGPPADLLCAAAVLNWRSPEGDAVEKKRKRNETTQAWKKTNKQEAYNGVL